jgi:DNA-binding transcriptional MerR regulator
MKIRELVQATGVSKETIHYYIREGVLRKPRATGKNSADYHEGYVDQIRIVKQLQDNYFLPLSVIKKIIRQRKRQSPSEQSAFESLSTYLRPLDRLLSSEITGRAAFAEATGLSGKWLERMEQWQVVTAEWRDGEPVYSQDDVTIGRLIVDMDRNGFGPKDGYDPQDLKIITDFIRAYAVRGLNDYYRHNLERLSSEEMVEKGGRFTEIMSLFFYQFYRKVVKEEYARLLKSAADGENGRAAAGADGGEWTGGLRGGEPGLNEGKDPTSNIERRTSSVE